MWLTIAGYPMVGISTWVPTSHAAVFGLTDLNRPTSDVDGGVLGRDPGVLVAGAIAVPVTLPDPALAAIQPSQAPWETPNKFGKWGSQETAAPVTLSYSFYDTGSPAFPNGDPAQPAALDAAHRAAVRSALASFADVANITFVEVAEAADTIGTLRFIDDRALDTNAYTAAYAASPLMNSPRSGLVAFDVDRFGIPDDLSRGGLFYGTIVHEIGHALGLTHPFDSGDPAPVAGDPRAAWEQWHRGWTMMAYTAPGRDLLASGQTVEPIGPMLADVAVLQAYYGANRSTRTGDDVYAVDGRYPLAALWDAGGRDIVDASLTSVTLAGEAGSGALLRRPGDPLPLAGWFSGWSGVHLDLRPGAISPHLAVAYGAAIEDAIGSRGDDLIVGTDPGTLTAGDGSTMWTDGANRLEGGAGNDTLLGLAGDDTLVGGSGNNLLDGGDGFDTAVFGVASTAVTIAQDGADLVVTGAGFVDRLRRIDSLAFTDRALDAVDAVSQLAPTPVPSQPGTPTPTPTPGSEAPAPQTPPPAAPSPQAPPAQVPVPVIDPSRRLAVWSGGVSRELEMQLYVGPVAGLRNMHIGDSSSEAIRGSDFNDFINSVAGDDAIDGGAGDDVLDGGTGSNFLTGGAGTDTFFVDARGGGVTWSTITDLEPGEWVTAWGWRPGVSTLKWEELAGADGFKGATARIDLDGNGTIDESMTFTGKGSGAIFSTPGQVGDSSYMAFILR
ncbi:M10 family metallopeptidase [Azospirillum aestuarii]|nr:M10 family metallopeptidase [Azospirillum aestuarii]